jgi:hypothetical protein
MADVLSALKLGKFLLQSCDGLLVKKRITHFVSLRLDAVGSGAEVVATINGVHCRSVHVGLRENLSSTHRFFRRR